MIDKILLAPYWWSLKLRHCLYDHGVRKVHKSSVPTVCIGNITVGGTGKTPHTEMLLRILAGHSAWSSKRIAVLSRGYRRKSKGFQAVSISGTTAQYGDEPLQIKRKFPETIVAVDRNRVEGCRILGGEAIPDDKGTKGGNMAEQAATKSADLIILDDAFQYRALKADLDIVLMDYNRPVYKDHLLPLGRLRDLPERISRADIVIVTKCPSYLDEWERGIITESLGFKGNVFFTTVGYETPGPVFPEGDRRYIHSQWLILVTGIANPVPMTRYLSDSYKIVRHLAFGDHHRFSGSDIRQIIRAAEKYPAAVIVTTEKDSQRLLDMDDLPGIIRERLFKLPIRADFLTEKDASSFMAAFDRHISAAR